MKSKLKSLISVLITACMIMSIVSVGSFATIFGDGTYEFSFDCQPTDTSLTVGTIKINNNIMTSEEDRFKTNDGKYTIYVEITSTSGREPSLGVNGDTPADITLDKTEGNKYTFKIIYDMAANHQNHLSVSARLNNPGGSGGEGPAANKTGTFTYSYEGEDKDACADIFINGTMLPNEQRENITNQNVDYYYDDSGNVTFKVGTIFLHRLTELKINGRDYSGSLPNTPEQMLQAFSDQRFFAEIQVPYAESYTITTKSVQTDAEHMVIGNFLWDRRTPSSEEEVDDCLDHGDIELVKLKYNGRTYYPGDPIFVTGSAYDWADHIITETDPTGITGGATLPAGAELTVKLVPEYGYQLVSFGPNGGSFTADDETQSQFTFVVGKGNFHLAAHFEKVEDMVSVKANNVKSGNIKIANDEIDTGSVVLSVNDVNLSNDKVEEFSAAAGDYKISQYLGIDLNQVIYKGTSNDTWTNKMDELNNEATISLKLSDDVSADDIVIVHNIHDTDEYEVINLESYDKNTNTITFKTKSFSSYAIATKSSSIAATALSKKLQTGDSFTNIIVAIAIISVASIGVILMLEKNKNIYVL